MITEHNDIFTELYKGVYMDMYKYAYYVLGNAEDAQDAVAAAAADAYAGFARLRDIDKFKNWIFAILSVYCKKTLKVYANRHQSLDELNEQGFEAADEKTYEAELYMDVKQAFAMLTSKERQIVAMSSIAGYSSSEIGKLMHINSNTVRTICKRALEKMKVYLNRM